MLAKPLKPLREFDLAILSFPGLSSGNNTTMRLLYVDQLSKGVLCTGGEVSRALDRLGARRFISVRGLAPAVGRGRRSNYYALTSEGREYLREQEVADARTHS